MKKSNNNLLAISLVAIGAFFLLVNKKSSAPTSAPKFVIGDIIAIGSDIYTVHGVDIYTREYLLYEGRYPYDTIIYAWVSSDYIDRISTKIDHVIIFYS